MEKILGRFADQIYSLTRIVVGFLFLCHGAQKLFIGLPAAAPEAMAPLLYAAGVIELVAGALVMVGLFTGWAAFIASGQMAVAYFLAHQTQALLPIQNQGELAVLYAWSFLLIARVFPFFARVLP